MSTPRCIWAAATVWIAGCSQSVALSVNHADAIRDSVQATLNAFTDRSNAADRDSLLRFYQDDSRFVWAANGKVGVRSVSAIKSAFESLAPYKTWHVEYRNLVIVPLAPGVASVATEYTQSLADSSGRAITYGGALTMVWINTPAGWKLLEGHSSSPAPAIR